MAANPVEVDVKGKPRASASEEARTAHWLASRRGPALLDPFIHMLDPADKRVQPYVRTGMVVADLGCGWGRSAFALADRVGPDGRVYAVDLAEKCIRSIKKKAERRGRGNLEARVSTAADVGFIPDGSVDFVFANGLLCSMATDRPLAVREIERILKPGGLAYVSLGAAPPYGYVDREEWAGILARFQVQEGGSFDARWALLSPKPAPRPPAEPG